MSSLQDYQLAALAAGFTLGFGVLCVWEAIKQTRRNKNPLRSHYIYMVWGEILANVCIGILAWLFLNGVIKASVTFLFWILVFWVFEVQLLMQIIINRIALIAENRKTVRWIKWGTVYVITSIEIAVFCIWIPAHMDPPMKLAYDINMVWDKISKSLILVVDAALNWYFLRTVNVRLVQQHGLVKYKPLVGFNAKLMVVSIAMDALLIGLMFLKNGCVYMQFHPLVYMVKLNIEMSMASLVVRLAQGKPLNDMDLEEFLDTSNHHNSATRSATRRTQNDTIKSIQPTSRAHDAGLGKIDSDSDECLGGIECTTELNVVVEKLESGKSGYTHGSARSSAEAKPYSVFGDETPLHKSPPRTLEHV